MGEARSAGIGSGPNEISIQEMKRRLGEFLHRSDRPGDEKEVLNQRLHAADDEETLAEVWRDITGADR